MGIAELFLYFLLGGVVVSLVTYLGSNGQGFMAAFISVFPSITVLTFLIIFNKAGGNAVINYAKGMFLLQPAWWLYLGLVIVLANRLSFPLALGASILLYIACAFVLKGLWG